MEQHNKTQHTNLKQIATWVDVELYNKIQELRKEGYKISAILKEGIKRIEEQKKERDFVISVLEQLRPLGETLSKALMLNKDLVGLSEKLTTNISELRTSVEELKSLRDVVKSLSLLIVELNRGSKEIYEKKIRDLYEIVYKTYLEFDKELTQKFGGNLPSDVAQALSTFYGKIFKETIDRGILTPQQIAEITAKFRK